ncbi:hypothetical protein [Alicyclobacillus pomorum]|uniref:hypothetical protein n=1 Tax=Alicyclobacillus pomorum TaxID=204470 RepID=UPI000406266F|nr:hypothetical protein [Alicyclobacillus pomorum]
MIPWNQYPPTAYQWDYIPPSAWKTLNPLSGVVPGALNDVANFVFTLGTMSFNTLLSFLQFSIDPSSLLNPVEQEIGNLLHKGYSSVFLPLFPAMVSIVALFLLYRFVRAHHASVMQIITMFVVITGMAMYFYTNFAPVMKQLTTFDDAMSGWMLNTASEIGQAATGTVGVNPNINNTLSVIWDQYVLTPWEQGEFGKASPNLSDYNVSKQEVGKTWKDDNGKQQTIKPTDNWVNLMLSHEEGGDARSNLAGILYDTSTQRAGAYANANPDPSARLAEAAFYVFFPLAILPPIIFVGLMGCLLLAFTFGFIFLVLKLAVTFPLGIIPDYGWNYFFKTLKNTAGVLISKVLHAMYLGITLLVLELVSNALFSANYGTMMVGLMINSVICVMAIIYRGWFIKAISSRLPKEYQWSWKEQIQKAKIEAQRGTAPVRNMARKIAQIHNRKAATEPTGVQAQSDTKTATKGALAGRLRPTNTERVVDDAKPKRPVKPVTKGVMAHFVSENKSFTEQSQTKNEKPIRKRVRDIAPPVQRDSSEPPKVYRVKSGQSALKEKVATMSQNPPKTEKPAPKMVARKVQVSTTQQPQNNRPVRRFRPIR